MTVDGLVVLVVTALLVAAVSVAGTLFYLERRANSRLRAVQLQADQILQQTEQIRRDAEIKAKDEAIRLRGDLDRELTQRRNEIERIEKRIAKIESTVPDLEDRVAKLTTELSSPDAAADFGRVAEISDRIKSTESEIAALYAEWESLADQL